MKWITEHNAVLEKQAAEQREWINRLAWKWRLIRKKESLTGWDAEIQATLLRNFVPDMMACCQADKAENESANST